MTTLAKDFLTCMVTGTGTYPGIVLWGEGGLGGGEPHEN